MEKAFLRFDLETVHALTLKFSLQPMGFDVKAEKKREAGRALSRCLQRLRTCRLEALQAASSMAHSFHW